MSDVRTDQLPKSCTYCDSKQLYTRRLATGGGQGPFLLLGLGSFLHFAEFDVVVCSACGLTQFFAEPMACTNVQQSHDWKHV
jgi:predicted nucleic-acid-binding Zn-ribbon protein